MGDCHGCPKHRHSSSASWIQRSSAAAPHRRHRRAAQFRQIDAVQPPHRPAPKGRQFPRRHRRAAHGHSAKLHRWPRGFRGRSARRLQPYAALGRRAGHARRADRPACRTFRQARRRAADSRFHQSGPPPGAGRADPGLGLPTLRDPQHGRRSAPAGGGKVDTSRARRATGRARWRWSARAKAKASRRFSSSSRSHLAAAAQAPPMAACRCLQDIPKCRAVGRPTSATRPAIARPRRPYGRAAWTRSSCIRWPDR